MNTFLVHGDYVKLELKGLSHPFDIVVNMNSGLSDDQPREDSMNLDVLIDEVVTADGFDSRKNPFGTVAASKLDIEKELEVLDENDKMLKWEELQKRKTKNDEKIAGMMTNVHRLLNEYGLDAKPQQTRKPQYN